MNGTAVCDDTEKAQVFNEYFIQCSTLDTGTAQLPSNYPSLTESHIGSWQTSVNDVVNCLSKIDTSKAVGPDGINPKLLKEGAHQLAPSLCKLYNLSLDLGKVPKIWKKANVIPLFKKNDKSILKNYRPVSILSSVGENNGTNFI